MPFSDFRDFVKTAPDIATGLPQEVKAFFMRLEIPDSTRGLIAIVTETIQPLTPDKKQLPLIFDIDVVRAATFEPSSPGIWETFEQMRDFKNEIFFETMTERTKEMFR